MAKKSHKLQTGVLIFFSYFCLCACDTAEKEWQKIQTNPSLTAYQSFLFEHRNHDLASEARQKIRETLAEEIHHAATIISRKLSRLRGFVPCMITWPIQVALKGSMGLPLADSRTWDARLRLL
ncbi:MAG: hypothetical protein ACE5G1_06655 [bacterium]